MFVDVELLKRYEEFYRDLFKGDGDVWVDRPSLKGIIIYSVVVPIISFFGIIANTMCLVVLQKRELATSVYTYLSVLAMMDFLMSILLLLGGLAKGVLWQYGWCSYDALIDLPVGGAINIISVFAIVGLTIDRVIYLWNPVQCTRPKFCSPWVARKLMMGSVLIAVVFNLPYCFIYTRGPNGDLEFTSFVDSTVYKVFNWMDLTLFSILPTIILVFGNGFLIVSLRRAKQINRKCCPSKKRDHTSLTITLVAIIICFLVSEIPANLVSRKAAINILYSGDHNIAASNTTMQVVRQVVTLISAINVSLNFILYYIFCPAFCKVLTRTLFCRIKNDGQKLQVNVFVLNDKISKLGTRMFSKQTKKAILEISRKSIESTISINFGDMKNAKGSKNVTIRNGGVEKKIEFEDYKPPFSTIREESSYVYNSSYFCD